MGTVHDMKQRIDGLRGKGLDSSSTWREKVEMARELIFKMGYGVSSQAVERVLAAKSWVPTRVRIVSHVVSHVRAVPDASQNTFLKRFHEIFAFTSMFVVDLLHEFELGVWKATFIHLLRILYAAGGDAIQELNKRSFLSSQLAFALNSSSRYRQVPTFGQDTIRRFHENASAMKKLAGRDYEDLLQVGAILLTCSFPDSLGSVQCQFSRVCCRLRIMKLSWIFCSPLPPGMRMPNYDFTPVPPSKHLKMPPKRLVPSSGVSPERLARHTIPKSSHKRRPHAVAVRLLWQQRRVPPPEETNPQQAPSNANSICQHTSCTRSETTQIQYESMAQPTTIQRKWYVRFLQLKTIVPDEDIEKGELEHRRVKRFYGRTNKQRFVSQIAKHQRREQLLQRIKQRLANRESSDAAGLPVEQPGTAQRGYQDGDDLPYTKPGAHYHISASEKDFENVTALLSQNRTERALQVGSGEFHASWLHLIVAIGLSPKSEDAPPLENQGRCLHWRGTRL